VAPQEGLDLVTPRLRIGSISDAVAPHDARPLPNSRGLPSASEWAWLLAFSVLYLLAARLGHVLTPQPRHFATFWPPGGLFLAALLVVRRPLIPWVVLAVVPPSLASNYALNVPPLMTGLFLASDIASALTVALAIRRIVSGRPSLSVLAHVLLFVAGCAGVSAIAALGGAATLSAFGSPFASSFGLWWQGDALGALIVGSVVLAWAERDEDLPALTTRGALEGAALVALALASTWAVFSTAGTHHLPTEMLLLPCLLWAALRFGQRGATALGLVVSLAAVIGAHEGRGPFAAISDLDERTLAVQVFLAVAILAQLLLAATVSERRKSAEALRRSQVQLFHAEKLEGIGRLAGSIAHDFNNILTIINTYADLVVAAASDPEVRADAEEIRRAGERGATLTRQLLALTRRGVVQLQVFDVGRAATGMEKLLRKAMGEQIELSITVGPEPSIVSIDPSQLEQVIMTLALNARDAMPNGGAMTLAVSNVVLRQDTSSSGAPVPAGEWVLLTLSDSGVGMSDEVQAQLFEPFFTTKERTRGTGLGLASVFAIVKNAGGHVGVSSTEGKGSTFRVFLPLSHARPTAAGPLASTAAPPHHGQGRTVLIAEDDASVRAMVAKLLGSRGYRVFEASSGPDAIALFERNASEISLVVSDVMMPRMSGKDVVDQLRRARPGLPILLVSGYAHDVLGRDVTLGERCAFLAKPFSEAALLDAVRALVESRQEELPLG
jgi:signal transduction histidine kinase/ActR/RegA family two-component response regulator